MVYVDKATGFREGESLDSAGIETFLKDSVPDLRGTTIIRQFPGGLSNLTYLVTIGDRQMVLRRPPRGTKARTAHNMRREYRILSALHDVYPYCPQPLAYCDDSSVIGCPFYVMERIKGVIIRRELPPDFISSEEQAKALCYRLIEVLHQLHSIEYHAIGFENFGNPQGYIERQIQGWARRYRAAKTPDAPDFEDIIAWFENKMPADSDRAAIIHNDFKLDNVVLAPDDHLRIIGVLDWEVATVGDPLMDLGSSLGYWVQKGDPPELQTVRFMPAVIDSALTREDLVRYYAELSGHPIDDFDFYYCFGLFRLAVGGQQIYYRYYHGQTSDKRFKALIQGIIVLEKVLRSKIRNSEI